MGNGLLERKLHFEKKNQGLVKLPKYAKVEKRPIPHAPIASPYAGASVPKIVYVSSGSPFMSVVKRVQKLLRQAEKRATANISLEDTRKSEKQKLDELAQVADKREAIFVKATGRAIEKALSVGKWFEEKEAEYTVRVNTGSVLVVDDVIEDEEKKNAETKRQQGTKAQRSDEKDDPNQPRQDSEEGNKAAPENHEAQMPKPAAKKRKRKAIADSEKSELPETRTRWIKMVEVAVSLK